PGERREAAVPSVLAPRGRAGAGGGVREAEPVSRQPLAVLPGETEEHAGRRREPARPLDDSVRQPDGRRQRAQPQAGADFPGGRREREAEGQPARALQGRDADGERAADDAPQAGREGGEVRRQHRGSGYLGGGMFYRFGILLCLAWAASAAGDTRVADAASRGDREAVRALARQKADVKGAQ